MLYECVVFLRSCGCQAALLTGLPIVSISIPNFHFSMDRARLMVRIQIRSVVSYPDPSTSQLRMDYITATLELGSGKVTAKSR